MAKDIEMPKYSLYLVTYTESERGWGCRPDGFSLHTSIEKARKFVADFTKRQRERDREANIAAGLPASYVPDCYTSPDGDPRLIEVSKKVYDKCVASGGDVWGDGNSPRLADNRLEG